MRRHVCLTGVGTCLSNASGSLRSGAKLTLTDEPLSAGLMMFPFSSDATGFLTLSFGPISVALTLDNIFKYDICALDKNLKEKASSVCQPRTKVA